MIAVVDYGLGNLASVRNALRAIGVDCEVTSDPTAIRQAGGVILPGVGAAGSGMEGLRARGLVDVVREVAERGRPTLGICLGMQLLFDRSEEGDVPCLGLLPGTVRLLHGSVKVPHIGWNQVRFHDACPLSIGLPPDSYFYFVHSYVCEPSDPAIPVGSTEYGEEFCSAVVRDSLWGVQFHPERSGAVGLRLLSNFVAATRALSLSR